MTGSAKYTVYIHHDGQLEGVILRSQLAHARVSELDLTPARALPGVSAAISLLGDDRDMLEDLVAAAFNDAVRKAEATTQEKMAGISAGLPLPPGFKMPF